jgi:hypothetical protein
MVLGLWCAALVVGVAATLGRARRFSLPALAVGFLVLATYGNSWGQLFHTEHLITLHLAVLAAAAFDTGAVPSGWPLRLMTVLTAITYAVAGLSKLRLGGWDWLDGEALRHQVAYDNIRKELVGSVSSPIAGRALGWRAPWAPMALTALLVELGAPLFVLRRRARFAWAALAWLFHVGIVVLMAIAFTYPLSGVAFASMVEPERGWFALRRRFLHAPTPATPAPMVRGTTE